MGLVGSNQSYDPTKNQNLLWVGLKKKKKQQQQPINPMDRNDPNLINK